MTGITRGGEVTVTHDAYNNPHYNPEYPSAMRGHYEEANFGGQHIAMSANDSSELVSSSDISYFNPDMVQKHDGLPRKEAPYFNQQQR